MVLRPPTVGGCQAPFGPRCRKIRKPDDFQPAGFDPLDVPQGRFPGDIEDPGCVFQHVKITGVERAGVRHGKKGIC
jgi:hypothetical protein